MSGNIGWFRFSLFILLVQDFGYQEFPKLRTQALIDVPIGFISLWVFFSFLESFRVFGEEVSLEADKIEETLIREQLNHRIQRTKLRRLLSKLLHGNIQGGLAAVSLALVSSQAGNPPNRDQLVQQAEAKLRKVQVELNDILTLELSDENFSNSNYDLSLSLIQSEIEQWQGLLDIKLHFADQALSVASALGLGDAVLTAVRESLQNSVRHGHARNVEISLEIYSKEIVLLIQDDGGYELREPLIEGQGGREIAAAGGTRNLTRADGLTTVRVSWDISGLD
jgi:signal transduction histidine kinase